MARILIAEDDEGLRKTYVRYLEHLKHEVVAVEDGAAAWELLRGGEKFALVLSDHDMPFMNGLELLRHLRSLDSKIPFALITGADSASDGRTLSVVCQELGARFFSKVGRTPFADIVSEMLANARAA